MHHWWTTFCPALVNALLLVFEKALCNAVSVVTGHFLEKVSKEVVNDDIAELP